MVAKGWGVGVDLGLRLRRDTPHRSLRLFRFFEKSTRRGYSEAMLRRERRPKGLSSVRKKGENGGTMHVPNKWAVRAN